MPRQRFVASGGRARAADARRRLSRAAVRPSAARPLAVGGIGVGRDGAAGGTRRLPLDGDRRTDSRADARHARFSRDGHGHVDQPERLYRPYAVRGRRRARRVRVPRSRAVGSDRVHLRGLGVGGGRRRLRRAARGGRPPVSAARGTGGEEARASSSSSTARMPGSISRAAAGRSCARCIGGSQAHPELRTVTMSEACAEPAAELARHLSRVVDRRELLHLDWPSRTTSGPGASWPTRARRSISRATGDAGAAGAGARGGPDRRRQRLVLVVRRRPFVGPRPGVRRPVPAASAERLPAAAPSRFRTSCSSATSRPARRRRSRSQPTAFIAADHRRRGDAATSNGSAPASCEVTDDRRGDAPERPGGEPRHRRAVRLRPDASLRAGRLLASRRSTSLAEGYEVSLKFLLPQPIRFSVKQEDGRPTGAFWRRPDGDAEAAGAASWVRRGAGGAVAGVGAVLEVALPLSDLGAAPATPLAFFVAVYDPHGDRARAASGASADRADGAGRVVRGAAAGAPSSAHAGRHRRRIGRLPAKSHAQSIHRPSYLSHIA